MQVLVGCVQHRDGRNCVWSLGEVEPKGSFEGGQLELVDTDRPRERVTGLPSALKNALVIAAIALVCSGAGRSAA